MPLALLLASIGGYFLARKSLAPVVKMSATASRIGAANLHERLPVANGRDELGGLALVINSLLARLDRSFEQQRRFMADASHELRTPIAIMRSEAEVALSEPQTSNAELRESIRIFRDETKRLTAIVEDLFMLARADAGQYKLTPKEFYDWPLTCRGVPPWAPLCILNHTIGDQGEEPHGGAPLQHSLSIIANRRLALCRAAPAKAIRYVSFAPGSIQH